MTEFGEKEQTEAKTKSEVQLEREDRENEHIQQLKQEKTKLKAQFTKNKNGVYKMLVESSGGEVDTGKLLESDDTLCAIHLDIIKICDELYTLYRRRGDKDSYGKTSAERDKIETEFNNVHEKIQEHIQVPSGRFIGHKSRGSEGQELGHVMWKQLKRVLILVFNREKKKYESWRAAYYACIDNAPATPEYKLLQLRQYLSGEALEVIDSLGHSAAAYEVAKERLDRKYGGQRRLVAIHLEELENFVPVRQGNVKDFERFADLLDLTVVNLKKCGHGEELGDGSLHAKLLRKMTENMVIQYHRWLFEKEKGKSVHALREWVLQEAEFQVIASESVHGFSDSERKLETMKKTPFSKSGNRTHFSDTGGDRQYQLKWQRPCPVCGKSHSVYKCDELRCMNSQDRWDTAERNRLCFRCLGENHRGKDCRRSSVCGIKGCQYDHNRLLHVDVKLRPTTNST